MSGVLKAKVGGQWVPIIGSGMSGEVARWNSAWGVVVQAVQTAAQNGMGATATDITGLTVTFVPVVGRRYKTTLSFMGLQNVGNSVTVPVIADGANVVKQQRNDTINSGCYFHANLSVVETFATATAVVRKGRYSTTLGNTDLIVDSTLFPNFIVVEDVGPVTPSAVAPPNPTPAWIPLTFTGTWGNADTTNYNTAAYRSIGDIVYLRGYVKSTSTDLTVGVLPVGFRPPKIVPFTAYGQAAPSGSQAAFRCGVHFNGNIFVNWAAGLTVNSMTYLDLENVQFSVTP